MEHIILDKPHTKPESAAAQSRIGFVQLCIGGQQGKHALVQHAMITLSICAVKKIR